MENNILHIKNMVCNRCIRVVNEELTNLGVHIKSMELGKVEISEDLDSGLHEKISRVMKINGFELIDDRKSQIIDLIKTTIIKLVHHYNEKPDHVNFSDFLTKEIGYDYSYLSNLYSSVEGITIEKYFISQKVEKVKELLVYNELSLNEIAFRLGYSSVQHLSMQFKKITGLSPSHFKKIKDLKRKPIDKV